MTICRPDHDFYYGYSNWALAAQRTHLVWHASTHNKSLVHSTSATPKDWQHIWLSPDDINMVLDEAEAAWKKSVDVRAAGTKYMNGASPN